MNIGKITEKLIRKIKRKDETGIELEIEDLLSDEEEAEEGAESESAGGWMQTVEDKGNDDLSFEDDPFNAAKGEEGEKSDEWVQQEDDKTDSQAFGQGDSDVTDEDTLSTELKRDDELADQGDHEILEYLEDVTAEELVRDMNDILRESRRRNA